MVVKFLNMMGIWKVEPVLFFGGCLFFVVAMLMLIIKKYSKTPKSQIFEAVYSWVDVLWSSLLAVFVVMSFFVQAFKIPSGSMMQTLLIGDYLFVNKFIYGFKSPFIDYGKRYMASRNVKPGDIVVFQCPTEALTVFERQKGEKKDFIKRCVAVGGDKVEIKNKKLYVNDTYVEEPYAVFEDHDILHNSFNDGRFDYQKSWERAEFAGLAQYLVRDNFGPVIVPEGHYMMLGDNRDHSFDSRFWGPLPDKCIKGKALFLFFPVKRWRIIK